MLLHAKLKFYDYLDNMLSKLNKAIAFFHKFQSIIPRPSLVTIYDNHI